MYDRVMRGLRLKYGVSCRELAESVKMSRQRIVQIEMMPEKSTGYQLAMVQTAFEKVILQRRAQVNALEEDYNAMKNSLLEYQEVHNA